jgi:serine/threonine protein kinase
MANEHRAGLEPGQIIGGRYEVIRPIARGGMATVLLVRHLTLNSSHALKILDIQAPEIRHRLLQEGMVQANLQHPNIVSVTDTLELDGSPALVMEYIDGPSLQNFLSLQMFLC